MTAEIIAASPGEPTISNGAATAAASCLHSRSGEQCRERRGVDQSLRTTKDWNMLEDALGTEKILDLFTQETHLQGGRVLDSFHDGQRLFSVRYCQC